MLKRRRRAQIKDLIYADITATSPTAIIQGQEAAENLFQNSAGSVLVSSEGDPVGGAREVIFGNVDVVQTTDAARPVWDGDAGFLLEGGEFLDASPYTQLSPADSWTIHILCRRTAGDNQSLITWSDSGSTIGYLLWAKSNQQMGIRVGTGSQAVSANDAWPVGWHVVTLRNTGLSGTHTGFVDGVEVVSQSTPSSPDIPAGSIGSLIGARNNGAGGGEFFFDGNVALVVPYHGEAQDDATISSIATIIGGYTP